MYDMKSQLCDAPSIIWPREFNFLDLDVSFPLVLPLPDHLRLSWQRRSLRAAPHTHPKYSDRDPTWLEGQERLSSSMATNSNPNPPNGNTGQSQAQSTGTIPNNLGPAQILQLIATNPELLTDSERVLPDQAKIQIIHNKIVKLVQQQKMKAQAQGPGNNGNAGGNATTNGGGNANAQLNVNGNGNGNNGQASTPGPSGPSNANTPGSGPGSAGPPPKRPPGRPSNQQVAAARAAAAAMQATQSQHVVHTSQPTVAPD